MYNLNVKGVWNVGNELRLVRSGQPKRNISFEEKLEDHNRIIEEYLRSKKLRNHVENSIYKTKLTLDNFFSTVNKFCWEVLVDDVKDYLESLIDIELAISTRRRYLNDIKLLYDFIVAHPIIPIGSFERSLGQKFIRIDDKYGIRVEHPVDRWFLPQHKTDDVPQRAIPTKDQLREFFRFIRLNMADNRKDQIIARDYAMFRLIYNTGLRENEAVMLDLKDLRFDLGTIHVRFGKGTHGSGPRERYVPMTFYGHNKILSIYQNEVRSKFLSASTCSALFLSEWGGRIGNSTVRNRLTALIKWAQESGLDIPIFSVHDLRRAFATHLYEEHPEKIEAIRICFGHWNLATTQRYLRPSSKFIEKQFQDITNNRLERLMGEDIYD